MALNRIRIAKDKAELVKSLLIGKGTKAPFQTYADIVVFAAVLGQGQQRRVPFQEISQKEPSPISLEVFISRGYDWVIKLLAIAETEDPKILSLYDPQAEEERNLIFEEYANGGLEILRHELKGAVDYGDRILLMITQERFKDQIPTEEFDLSRFL